VGGVAGRKPGGTAEKAAPAVAIVVVTAEQDRVIGAELEIRQRLEADHLRADPGTREGAVAVELTEHDLQPHRAEVAPDPWQMDWMDVLEAQRGNWRDVVAHREGREVPRPPPHLFLTK